MRLSAGRKKRSDESSDKQEAIRGDAPPDGCQIEPERLVVCERIHCTAYGLLEEEIVDIFLAAVKKGCQNPQCEKHSNHSPGLPAEITPCLTPFPLDNKKNKNAQRRDNKTHRTLCEERHECPYWQHP